MKWYHLPCRQPSLPSITKGQNQHRSSSPREPGRCGCSLPVRHRAAGAGVQAGGRLNDAVLDGSEPHRREGAEPAP